MTTFFFNIFIFVKEGLMADCLGIFSNGSHILLLHLVSQRSTSFYGHATLFTASSSLIPSPSTHEKVNAFLHPPRKEIPLSQHLPQRFSFECWEEEEKKKRYVNLIVISNSGIRKNDVNDDITKLFHIFEPSLKKRKMERD